MSVTTLISPYVGLMPYDAASAEFFFGRDQEIQRLTSSMFAYRLTLAYGPSGAGKSSVLYAGIPSRWQGRNDLLTIFCRDWQYDPLEVLKIEIVKAARAQADDFAAPDSQLPLDQYLAAVSAQFPRRMMIVLDQFEEFFLYHPDDTTFSAALRSAIFSREAQASILISLREEAVGKLERFRDDLPELFDHIVYITQLTRSAAREAIVKPLAVHNELTGDSPMTIEPALVDCVLDGVTAGHTDFNARAASSRVEVDDESRLISTPYLQMVLLRLWQEEVAAQSRVMRLQTLNALGGVSDIVRTHLDRVMDTFPKDYQKIAAHAFDYLVTPSGTKIAHTVSDLAAYTEIGEAELEQVLTKLTEQRIIRSVPAPPDMPGEPRFEIFHDMLAASVLDWRSRYLRAEEDEEARHLVAAETRAFEQARFARRLRRLIAVAAVLLVITAMTAAFAVFKGRDARASEVRARESESRAQDEKKRAEMESDRANFQAHEATKNLNTAQEQKEIADAAFREAKTAQRQAQIEAAQAKRLLKLANEATYRADALNKVAQLLLEGFSFKDDGEIDEALKRYQEALRIAETTGDRSAQAKILRSLALVWDDDDNRQAVANYERALAIYRASRDVKSQAETLREMGELFRGISADWRQAPRYYERAIELYRQAGDQAAEIATLERLASIYGFGRGERDPRDSADTLKSISLYEQVLSFYREGKNHAGEAEALKRLGDLHSRLVSDRRASVAKRIEFYKRAAEVYHNAGDFAAEADEFQVMLAIVYSLDEPAWVIEILQQQIKVYQSLGRSEDAAKTISHIGDIMYERMDKKEEALNYLQQAAHNYHIAGKSNEEGLIVRTIGGFYYPSKDNARAIPFYEQAAALFKGTRNRLEEARTEDVLGRIYSDARDWIRAIEHYEKARGLFDQSSEMRGTHLGVLEQLIYLYEQQGKADEAAAARKEYETLKKAPPARPQ